VDGSLYAVSAAGIQPIAAGLAADQPDIGIGNECMERSDRVGSAAHARDHGIGPSKYQTYVDLMCDYQICELRAITKYGAMISFVPCRIDSGLVVSYEKGNSQRPKFRKKTARAKGI
jgi:hypothetical protein